MIRIKCRGCEKPIDVSTPLSSGVYTEEEEVPHLLGISLEGAVVVCSSCKKNTRISFDAKKSKVICK